MDGFPRDEFDEDFDLDDATYEPAPPYWFPGNRMPDDARRMGLTHHVPEGALLDFAGRLDSSRTYHRVVAWVLLAVFGMPVVFLAIRLVENLGGVH
jgi:hypothetical protein